MTILDIKNVSIDFPTSKGVVHAVSDFSLSIPQGRRIGFIGESGSGKSVTALSVLQLLSYPYARHPNGSIRLGDTELIGADEKTLRQIRGNQVSMIFQEPGTSLNPVFRVGKQVMEAIRLHQKVSLTQGIATTIHT